MKSKLNEAIDTAFELVKQSWLNGGKHDMNLAIALDQLEPYVGQPWKTYNEERKAYWKEQILFHYEENDEVQLTEQQLEHMADKMLDWDAAEATYTDAFFDAIDNVYMDVTRDESEGV